jgi:hypothetical protein
MSFVHSCGMSSSQPCHRTDRVWANIKIGFKRSCFASCSKLCHPDCDLDLPTHEFLLLLAALHCFHGMLPFANSCQRSGNVSQPPWQQQQVTRQARCASCHVQYTLVLGTHTQQWHWQMLCSLRGLAARPQCSGRAPSCAPRVLTPHSTAAAARSLCLQDQVSSNSSSRGVRPTLLTSTASIRYLMCWRQHAAGQRRSRAKCLLQQRQHQARSCSGCCVCCTPCQTAQTSGTASHLQHCCRPWEMGSVHTSERPCTAV